jgi:ketosteroid isomerase-like protein
MAGDNVDVIEAAWSAFGKGDLDRATSIAGPEADIRIPESLPFGGRYHGPEGFRDYIEKLLGMFDDFKASPEKVLSADDEHVVVVANVTGRAKGDRFEARSAWVYRLRDGSVIEAELFTDTAAVRDAAS